MKYFLLSFILFPFITSFPQQEYVKARIDSLLSSSFFDTTQISVDVYDLTAKASLYKKNENLLLRPASNMKILTTTAALFFLGADYNFTTTLCYTGTIKNEVLDGNLYVIGGGDPDFNTSDLGILASAIKAAGISEIKGSLIGDVSMMDSLAWGKGWMWDDDCAFLTPLDINGNSIGYIVKPGSVGQKADLQLIPQTDFAKINNSTVTIPADSAGSFYLDKDWVDHSNTIIFKGTVSAKVISDSLQDTLYIKVLEPEKYFLSLFRKELSRAGINIYGENLLATVPEKADSLFKLKRSFRGIINNLNKTSYNLGAEMALRAMAFRYFGKPASAVNGIKMIDTLIMLAGLNPSSYRIVDGSGISHYNLVSTHLLSEVLKYIYYRRPDLYKILYDSFPVAGIDGTLSERMKGGPAENKVHAKTGTLSGVSSLSGFLTAGNRHEIVFSIILQGFNGSAKRSRDYEDKICDILAEYK